MENRQKSYDMQAHLCSPRRCGHHSAGRRRCRHTQHTAGQGMAGWGLAAGPRQDCWKPRRTPRSAPSLRPAAAWATRCCCKSNITISIAYTSMINCHRLRSPIHSLAMIMVLATSSLSKTNKMLYQKDVKKPLPVRSLRQQF